MSEPSKRCPMLSVVIASVNPLECIMECLAHLHALPEREQMEIIVMDRHPADFSARTRELYPDLIYKGGLQDKSIPELRWMGMNRARGELIAVIEDHCMVTRNWATEILKYVDSSYGVIGGPVENGCRNRLIDRALFIAEYAQCMPPVRGGDVEWVPGNNAAYRRSDLPLQEKEWANLWEMFLQKELRRRNIRMYMNQEMLVHHKKRFSLAEALAQRFFYSRSFAAMRGAAMTNQGRWFCSAASLLLPGLLLWRIASALVRKRREWPLMLQGLPLIGLFVTVWAAGECSGYLTGAGDSLLRVE